MELHSIDEQLTPTFDTADDELQRARIGLLAVGGDISGIPQDTKMGELDIDTAERVIAGNLALLTALRDPNKDSSSTTIRDESRAALRSVSTGLLALKTARIRTQDLGSR